MEFTFRIKFSLGRKLCGYEFLVILKQQNAGRDIKKMTEKLKMKSKKLFKILFLLPLFLSTSCTNDEEKKTIL